MAEGEPNGGIRYTTREMFDQIRGDLTGIREEMRKSRHDLVSTVKAIELRLVALETFQKDASRRLDENDERARTWIPRIEHLLVEETLAATMKKVGWTKRERLMAYGLVLFAFVGAVGTVVSLIVLARGGS